MAIQSHKTQIIVAIIGALGLVIAAIIQFYPWKKESMHKFKPSTVKFMISGTVIDEKTDENIAQAEINVVGRNEQYYTEQNGNFSITFLDSLTTIRLRVLKHGYSTFDKSFNIPQQNIIIQLSKGQDD